MSASSHTFWPSFPTLEATFSTVSDGSWRFGLQQIGVLVDCYMNEVGRGPKILWIPAAMHFGLPSQCWKRPSTLPMMVYGVLVQNILGSWWIDELGGDPIIMATNSHTFGLPFQHWKCPSTLPMLIYGVLVQHFWGF